MNLLAALLSLAHAGETLAPGPGTYAVSIAPLSVGQMHIHDGIGADRSATSVGVGLGTRISVAGMLADPDKRLFVADFVGLDLMVGGRSGPGSPVWALARLDLGVGLVLRSDEVELWLRAGAQTALDSSFDYVAGDGAPTGKGGWVVAAGADIGPLFVELAPALGSGVRLSQARVMIAPSDKGTFQFGVLAERVVHREYPMRRSLTRAMFVVVMR